MSDQIRVQERGEALHLIAVQHEADCDKSGIFTEVSKTEAGWATVIEHYDPAKPLERVGTPCRYTAEQFWRVGPT